MSADNGALSQQVVLPNRCLVAFGLPMTAEDFDASIEDPNRDYAKHYLGGWNQYEQNFVQHAMTAVKDYATHGVKVITGLRRPGFTELFSQVSVVTIFTHWTMEGIELCDGILSLPSAVESIPYRFSGVLDLCVCHPDDLVALLLRDRPFCSVRYLSQRTTPLFWLKFYAALYRVLALGGRTYSGALEEVTLELRRQTKRIAR